MGPGDLPAPAPSAKAAEVRQPAKSGALKPLYEELARQAIKMKDQMSERYDAGDMHSLSPQIKNLGQIEDMLLPAGWVEGGPYKLSGPGARSLREVHPPDQLKASLGFYYRGMKVAQEYGRNFHEILQREPHLVSVAELKSLGDILRDKARPEDFALYKVHTVDWNGKRVLVVEGRYKELQQDAFEIFVDAGNDGQIVQEIYYQAPKDADPKHLKAAKDSMLSIRWK